MTMTPSASSDWIARLTWDDVPGGAVVLGKADLRFRVEGLDPDGMLKARAALANISAEVYVPSPSKGEPGYGLARKFAEETGAKAEYAPLPPHDPNVVY